MEKSIWRERGFTPFVAIAFVNAFTDLGHKIVIQNALFKMLDGGELRIYTALIQAMILLPFIMTFTPAGYFADRFAKHRIVQLCAALTIPITLAIIWCYHLGAFWPAFGLTFVLALQSAFYSPAKYGYIRELIGRTRLAPANAAMQAVVLSAILAGTIAYSFLFESLLTANYNSLGEILQQVQVAGWLLFAGAVIETLLALRLPNRPAVPQPPFNLGRYLSTGYLRDNLKRVFKSRGIWLSIVGLSVFFAVNQVILATYGAHLKEVVGETDTRIANGLMALAGVGIVVGAMMAGRWSRDYIETGMIPAGALGMFIGMLLLPSVHHLPTLAGLFLFYGFCAGLFIVPLNALIQFYAREGESGVVLAGNNFIQNIAMLVFLGLSIVIAQAGISTYWTLYALAGVALIGFFYALLQLPQSFVRYVVRGLLAPRYRLQVVNMDHMPRESGVLLLGNHVSWLDWAILQMASPRPIRFVMARSYYEKWYLRWFLDLFGVIPIAPGASKDALANVHDALLRKEVVAIFPEGHISRNGHLSIFRSGFERAADNSGAAIVPFYLHGLWGSQLSYSSGAYRRSSQGSKFSRLITVAFGEPLPCNSDAALVKQAVQETSIHAWDEHVSGLESLPASFIRTARSHAKKVSVIDGDNQLTYSRLLAAVLAFRRQLQPTLNQANSIGILLPSSAAAVIANLAGLIGGRTLVNLNYTAPVDVVTGCIQKAQIKSVLTSRLFLTKLEKRGIDLTPLMDSVELIYMEDLREQIPAWRFALAFLQSKFFPTGLLIWLHTRHTRLTDTAAILFSSGSEGTPKGVMLSHGNIVANIKQVACVLNADDDDVMLNALPTFHAFGLTVTTLLPLLEAIPMVCQADPTDARAVARLVAKHRVTVMIATATFLRMYVRSKKVHPLMFESLRIVVTGAERLPAEVRDGFRSKFGKTVFEGYGTTETTPVATVNIPDLLLDQSGTVQTGNKPGSVGLPLPGTRIRIVDPETLAELPTDEAGLVLVGGSQVMQGYLDDPDKTAEVVIEHDGLRWYKTGDKGKLDKDGFLTILDRYSRFAKLGGEMVSLSSVEQQIAALLGDVEVELLAVALPEPSKGEQIVLLIDDPDYALGLRDRVLQSVITALMQPKHYFAVEAIPKLGTGKVDLTYARQLAAEALEEL